MMVIAVMAVVEVLTGKHVATYRAGGIGINVINSKECPINVTSSSSCAIKVLASISPSSRTNVSPGGSEQRRDYTGVKE